jgi:Mg/Co/Ni transporter MgtE
MKRLIVLLLLVNLSILLFKFGNYTIQTNIVYITNYNTPKKEHDSNRAIVSTKALKEVPIEVLKEVPIEVLKEVPNEVYTEVPNEVLKDVPNEVYTEVLKDVPNEVYTEVLKDVPNEVYTELHPLAVHPSAVHPSAVHPSAVHPSDNDIDERVAKILLSFQKMNFTDSVYSYM